MKSITSSPVSAVGQPSSTRPSQVLSRPSHCSTARTPQAPQWAGVVARLVSQPLDASPSQSPKPVAHAPTPQVPLRHAGVALAAAQTALNGGRRDEAIGHLIAAVTENPAQPVNVWRVLTDEDRGLVAQLRSGREMAELGWPGPAAP